MDDYAPVDQAHIEECSRIVFDVVPQVMQHIRSEMRRYRAPDLSVLQLRALAFLRRNPSMSSQVSGMVARKLIHRSTSTADRRYITLTLTEEGMALLQSTRDRSMAHLAETFSGLSPQDTRAIIDAMMLLANTIERAAVEADSVPRA
jgi:DNA-binding MarR family transcriptional regulator